MQNLCLKCLKVSLYEFLLLQARFNQLLEHRCPLCDEHDEKCEDQGGGGGKQQSGEEEGGRKKTASSGRNKFPTFRQLDKHVRVEHDRYYCDLCSGHLKVIWSNESSFPILSLTLLCNFVNRTTFVL